MLALLFLLLGILHYLLIRGGIPAFQWPVIPSLIDTSLLPVWFTGSFPSFCFVCIMIFADFKLLKPKKHSDVIFSGFIWVSVAVLAELSQATELRSLSLVSGTFDSLDIAASLIAGICSMAFLCCTFQLSSRSVKTIGIKSGRLLLFSSGLTMLVATTKYSPGSGCKKSFRPVLNAKNILWSEARDVMTESKTMEISEKIFVGSPLEGIHIFDFKNPSEPKNAGFLTIPGLIDFDANQTHLVANSVNEFVVLNINALPKIEIINIYPDRDQSDPEGCP